ncbi:SMP-30/gluconolactonase/LRE family protein [Ruegeria sp. 2012CJ41-6]|uniref:SMP-30/gluconolactonase/LRE family protein n=1 Tax=Ruegeria spongiae TaxID=2942209 RepID=A0ABT0Q1G5_9RHOB|nr:SMP-30/gluconolactonase/LRE family protein [Ruegeria spongiae]
MQRLFWIDSLEQRIWRDKAGGSQAQSWKLPTIVGSIGLCEDQRLIAGLADGFAFVDLSLPDAKIEWIGDPEPDLADTRLNDGKVDRQGRFWCGSMNRNFATANASLYRLDRDLTWDCVEDGITVSNGIAFSPDGRRMFFSNSRLDQSFQYDLDIQTGEISNRRDFVDTGAYDGRIDGATVDKDGNYWGALFQGGAVGCFSPDGQMLRKIQLPVSCPTMCSFGGPEMETLYVTSATFSMSDEEMAQEPEAGALFAVNGLGVTGIPESRFRVGTKAE